MEMKKTISELRKTLQNQLILPIFFAINPVPASRPKVTKYGTYYGKKYTEWRNQALEYIPQLDHTIDYPVIVLLENVIQKPKTSKRDFPIGDVDNYSKAPLDAVSKSNRVWVDDDLVLELFVDKRFAEEGEQIGTKMEIYKYEND